MEDKGAFGVVVNRAHGGMVEVSGIGQRVNGAGIEENGPFHNGCPAWP